MFTTVNVPSGRTFYEWQDIFHQVQDGDTLPDYHLDELAPEEERYLELEALTSSLGKRPGVVQLGKGVGNWQAPLFLVVVYENVCKLKQESFKWHGIKTYERQRPYSTCAADRQYMARLLDHAERPVDNYYFTPAMKPWLPWEDSVDLIKEEIKRVNPSNIICLGNHTAAYVRKYVNPTFQVVDPSPKATREDYKKAFRRAVT